MTRRSTCLAGLTAELMLAAGLTLAGAAAHADTHSTAPCKVVDAELQLSYQGDCVNGMAFGRGLAKGANGAWYEGQFLGGTKHGQGEKHFSSGDVYSGGWRLDERHGQGKYVFGEGSPWRGDSYDGYWKHDKRDGTGTYRFYPSGDAFVAYWKEGGTDTVGTTTLGRRKWAYQSTGAVLSQPGTQVCSVTTDGATPRRIAYGTVVAAVEDRVQVLVSTPEVLEHTRLKLNPRWDVITEWMVCTAP